MTKKYTKRDFVEAFWSKVKKTKTCWLWMGARNTVPGEEYGFVRVNGRTVRAHRVAYQMKHGRIGNGKLILHTCDNPPCVRWAHLFDGSSKDNAIDRNKKGRMTYHRGDKHWSRRHPERVLRGEQHWSQRHPEMTTRGERHGMAKLSNEEVSKIRRLYLSKKFSYKKLAAMFDVAVSTIGMLMLGKNWKFSSEQEKKMIESVRKQRFGVGR